MKGYYHKYFEDFEEERVPNQNGKGTHIEHKYVGYYFHLGMKDAVRIVLRILYALMGAAAVGCLGFASTRMAHCNTVGYSVVFQAITLLLCLWFLWVLVYYVSAPKDMTIYKYKSTALQILKVSKFLAAAFLLDAAAVIVDMISATGMERGQVICLIIYLAGALLVLAINLIERALPYERLSNDKEIVWCRQGLGWR